MITGGMIEATRFVEYLYQLVHSIGRKGVIVPNSNLAYYFPDGSGKQITYNPTILILDACFTALAVHALLGRSKLSDSELITLQRLIFLCQLTTQRLFALKQCILGINTPCFVTKSHMLHVFKILIEWFGFTGIFDTDIFESLHKYVKNLWKNSSRKLMYYQGKEIISMNRIVNLAKMNNDQDKTKNKNINNIKNCYLPSLGYVSMKSNNNIWATNNILFDNCNWIPRNNISQSLLPIHPILNLSKLNTYISKRLRDKRSVLPESWNHIIQETMKPYYLYKTWNLQLLKGIRLYDEYNEKPYIVYSKRDHKLSECPGVNATSVLIDRFNTIEIRYNDNDGIEQYAPATIFSTLRFSNRHNEEEDLILMVICWLQKDNLPIPKKRLYIADNVYSYSFQDGNLWLDIISIDQVINLY